MANEQISLFADNPEYGQFVEKFTPKKTTDDCYTPPLVYDAILDWACAEYGIDRSKILRPFYPGGDYESEDYPDGCVVLDNPPFSILSQIVEFYLSRRIQFFLFAPSLTIFSGRKTLMRTTHICCDANITYENGAVVPTGFITNLGGSVIARTAPDLKRAIDCAVEKSKTTRELPKYQYPNHIVTAAMLQKLSKYGVNFSVDASDCAPVYVLDAQREYGKSIYGGGLLLSEKAAAEKAAAEKAAAEKTNTIIWPLSPRELGLIKKLNGDDHHET